MDAHALRVKRPDVVSRVLLSGGFDGPQYHSSGILRTIGELRKATKQFPKRASELKLPLLIMSAGSDRIVAPSGARMLYDRASSEDKTLKVYPDLYHELFNETEPDRTQVIADMIAWLDARS